MYSKHHFLISVAVGSLSGWFLYNSASNIVLVTLFAGVIGVAIDFDHFPIARINTGNWKDAKGCLQHPMKSLYKQEDIFNEDKVSASDRMLSHLLISGIVILGGWILYPKLTAVTGVVLYFHLLADAFADATGYFK